MKTRIAQFGVLAVIFGLLASCGGSGGSGAVEQPPTASAKPAEQSAPKPAEQPPAQQPVEKADPKPADDAASAQSELEKKAEAAITLFKSKDPDMKKFFDGAKGYAVFPKVSKGGLIVGGAGGKGVVYERGLLGPKVVGYSTLSQGSIGLQVGGQVFSEIIFFQNEASLDKFKKGTTEFAGTVSAVAANAGASVDAAYEDGVLIFTAGESGLMLQASIGGQGFSFTPKK